MLRSAAMRSARRGTMIALLLAWLASCSQPVTQLTVIVRSDLDAADLAEIDVEVRPGEPFTSDPTATHTFVIGAAEGQVMLPYSFGVLPRGGDPNAHVELRLTVHGQSGGITLVRTLRTGFVRGRTLAVPIFLSQLCRTRTCDAPLTCGDDGTCVAPDVPVSSLVPVDPGRELADAARPDGGMPIDAAMPVSGLPPPTTREIHQLGTSAAIPTFVAPDVASGDVVVGVFGGNGGVSTGVLGAAGTDRPGSVVVRVGRDASVRWSRSFVSSATDTGRITQGMLAGNSVFVCGQIEGTMTPDGGAPLVAPDDGTPNDTNDAAFVARLDATTGALGWASLVTAGPNVACTDIALSGTTLAIGLAYLHPSSAFALDGVNVPANGCADPVTAVLRIDVSGASPRPLGLFGFENSAQGVLGIEGDDAGGFYATTSFFAAAAQVMGGGCFTGPDVGGGIVHLDAGGSRTWGAIPIALVGFGGLGMDLVRLDASTLRIVGTMSQVMEATSVQIGGTEVSPASMVPRAFTFEVSSADGSVIGPAPVIASGGITTSHVAASAPDTIFCGRGPDLLVSDTSFDVFGMNVSRGGLAGTGLVAALDGAGHARWFETAVGTNDGFVSACAPTGDGGAWVGAVIFEPGTVFGRSVPFGGFLVRLAP